MKQLTDQKINELAQWCDQKFKVMASPLNDDEIFETYKEVAIADIASALGVSNEAADIYLQDTNIDRPLELKTKNVMYWIEDSNSI